MNGSAGSFFRQYFGIKNCCTGGMGAATSLVQVNKRGRNRNGTAGHSKLENGILWKRASGGGGGGWGEMLAGGAAQSEWWDSTLKIKGVKCI